MRNPFTFTRQKVAETQKAVIDSGIQTAVDSTKEKVQNHFKENWQQYAINSAVFVSGVAAHAIFSGNTRTAPKFVETNVTYNIVHAQTVVVDQR